MENDIDHSTRVDIVQRYFSHFLWPEYRYSLGEGLCSEKRFEYQYQILFYSFLCIYNEILIVKVALLKYA